ncbi:MAG: hypothetical protein ACKO2P_15695 [Planctomycetota bacterium]
MSAQTEWQENGIWPQRAIDVSHAPRARLSGVAGLTGVLAALRRDQQQRWNTSQPWLAEDYLRQLPPLTTTVNWMLELVVGEWHSRPTDQPLTPADLLSRFPDLVDLPAHLVAFPKSAELQKCHAPTARTTTKSAPHRRRKHPNRAAPVRKRNPHQKPRQKFECPPPPASPHSGTTDFQSVDACSQSQSPGHIPATDPIRRGRHNRVARIRMRHPTRPCVCQTVTGGFTSPARLVIAGLSPEGASGDLG